MPKYRTQRLLCTYGRVGCGFVRKVHFIAAASKATPSNTIEKRLNVEQTARTLRLDLVKIKTESLLISVGRPKPEKRMVYEEN